MATMMTFNWKCPKCEIGLRREGGVFYSEDGKESKRTDWECPSCKTKLARTATGGLKAV